MKVMNQDELLMAQLVELKRQHRALDDEIVAGLDGIAPGRPAADQAPEKAQTSAQGRDRQAGRQALPGYHRLTATGLRAGSPQL